MITVGQVTDGPPHSAQAPSAHWLLDFCGGLCFAYCRLGARARAGVHFFSPAHEYLRQPREMRTTQISFHLLNKPRHTAPLSHGSRVAPTRHILRTRSTPDADPHQTDAHTLCTIRADADSGCRQRRPQQLRIAVAWRVAQARHTCHTGPNLRHKIAKGAVAQDSERIR